MMKEILHIVASPRGSRSYSYGLGKAIVGRLKADAPESHLRERHLESARPPYLTATQIGAFYKSRHTRSPAEAMSLAYSDAAIKELEEAGHIVISTPMYNMAIPACLKAWIDQVIRINVTFSYDAGGRKLGLLRNKKMYLAIASGRVHGTGNYRVDFIADYLRVVFKGIGITDISVYRVEGTAEALVDEISYSQLITDL